MAKINPVNITANIINNLLRVVEPDIIIYCNNTHSSADIFEVTCHELAHSSQFEKVRSDYWNKYINYIVINPTASYRKTINC